MLHLTFRSIISARYSDKHVLLAAILAAVMMITLTAYTCGTEPDYTKLLPYMTISSVILLVATVCTIFMKIPLLHKTISAVMVLFSVYIIVDTQLTVGGKTYELSLADYVIGAAIVYVDIITIEILKIIGSKSLAKVETCMPGRVVEAVF